MSKRKRLKLRTVRSKVYTHPHDLCEQPNEEVFSNPYFLLDLHHISLFSPISRSLSDRSIEPRRVMENSF